MKRAASIIVFLILLSLITGCGAGKTTADTGGGNTDSENTASLSFQRNGFYMNVLPDGEAEIGVSYTIQNTSSVPQSVVMFFASVLDKDGNTLATVSADTCMPKIVMPGETGFVWCTARAAGFAPDKLAGITDPQVLCSSSPGLTDASGSLAVSDEKCESVVLETGESTVRFSATVTNTGSKELSGCGGFFLVESPDGNNTVFPVAFTGDALLDTLAPGASVSVGADLSELLLRPLQAMGYGNDSPLNPDEVRFMTCAYAADSEG